MSDSYRGEYNKVRPHSSLGQQTPAAFRAGLEIQDVVILK